LDRYHQSPSPPIGQPSLTQVFLDDVWFSASFVKHHPFAYNRLT
jgi:hypothetical protein